MVPTTTTVAPEKQLGSTEIIRLRDDFYRDGFHMTWLSIALTLGAIGLLIIVSLYFFLHQVLPITFPVYDGFRVRGDVPVDKSYVPAADLVQWVSTVVPELFSTDFINQDQYLQNVGHYFTANGWAKYTNVVNIFMNHDDIVKNKYFISPTAAGAPVILNQGIIDGKYAWWVQMPINVSYSGGVDGIVRHTKLITQTLVIRVPTLNNLTGISIENIIVNRA